MRGRSLAVIRETSNGNRFVIPDRWSKAASLVFGAFTVVTALVQLVALPLCANLLVGAVTAGSALLALAFYFQFKRYDNALKWVARHPETRVTAKSADFSFRPAASEAAYAEVCRTSQEIYREANVPFDLTLKWWRQYQGAVFAAYWEPAGADSELAAYVSIWPLKRTTYSRLRAGKLREREISHRSIDGIHSPGSHRYWYVSNIVVARRHRRSGLAHLLLQHAVRHWLESGNLADEVSMVAFAFSPGGEKLLRGYGFHQLAESSADGWPIFELNAATRDLGDALRARSARVARA